MSGRDSMDERVRRATNKLSSSKRRTFDNTGSGFSSKSTSECWVAFGKVIDRTKIKDKKEHGFAAYIEMSIDTLEKKITKGSETNSDWDVKSQEQNKFYASVIKKREDLEPGDVVYYFPFGKDVEYAFQIRRRDLEAEQKGKDVDELANEAGILAEEDKWF